MLSLYIFLYVIVGSVVNFICNLIANKITDGYVKEVFFKHANEPLWKGCLLSTFDMSIEMKTIEKNPLAGILILLLNIGFLPAVFLLNIIGFVLLIIAMAINKITHSIKET